MKKERASKPGYGRIFDAWVPPVDAGDPVGCVATSFTFAPAMFEEECLGRFLALETNAVEDGPAYIVEREEKLSQLSCAAALVDQHHARGSRSLRWDLLAARVPRGILHSKVCLLLWNRHARLIVSSANLTEDGYRRNQEVFGVLDYFQGSESPISTLDELITFLQEAAGFAESAGAERSAAVGRWIEFLQQVTAATRSWGATESPRGFAKPRIAAVLSGPNRPSGFETLSEVWPDNSPPDRAFIVSPFFDPPDSTNEPANGIWRVLKQRGEASVEYNVTAEDVPGENALLLHAPESVMKAQPTNRNQIETNVQVLKLEENRPLHAKCIWLESERLVLHLVGSSNFTSAGLGLGTVKNIEANLAFIVGQQASGAKKTMLNAWPPIEAVPDNVEIRWRPREDDEEDSATGDLVLLPKAFADITFGGTGSAGSFITVTLVGKPPAGWALYPEEDDKPFATEADWQQVGSPKEWRLDWTGMRPPSGFRVNWADSGGFAWWPVNVLDSEALPAPEELKNLPLDVLIEILTSAKPLHLSLARWLKRSRNTNQQTDGVVLDPHKRVDTSAFLLQRTRRVSWALAALRQRLERPVVSEQSLAWRLRGPVGVLSFAEAIGREAHSDSEKCFLLTELCLELSRVRPQVLTGCLSKQRVGKALKELIRDVRKLMPDDAVVAEPGMAAYAKMAFEEVIG